MKVKTETYLSGGQGGDANPGVDTAEILTNDMRVLSALPNWRPAYSLTFIG